MMDAAFSTFGHVDILVNNAAIRPHKPFTEVTLEDWENVRGVVLDGSFYTTHRAIPKMVENNFGRIVFLTGDGAFRGSPMRAHVSAAKMGIVGMARSLASRVCRQQHPRQRGIARQHRHVPCQPRLVRRPRARLLRHPPGPSGQTRRNSLDRDFPVHR